MKSKAFIVLAVLFLCTYPAIGVVEFKDGLTHDIDYTIDDDVDVDYKMPDMYTTVNLLPGGKINWFCSLYGFEHSRINVLGGSLGWLWGYDSSQINISGGFMFRLNSLGSSQVNISGGTIGEWLAISGSSQVNISGGSISYHLASAGASQVYITGGSINDRIYSYDSSQVYITGGLIGLLDSFGSSQVNIPGGSIGYHLSCSGSSRVNITGGSIDHHLSCSGSGQVYISGGSIGDYLELYDQGEVQIFGFDFSVDGQPFGYGEITSIFGGWAWDEPWRHLTGTLLSGEIFDNDFLIGEDAKIILTIPEPASLLLLGLGGLFLRRRR